MDIIMLKDVEKVGDQYQIIKVKDGYGRNFLIPQGMAVVANDSNRRKFASIVRAMDKKELARLDEYRAVASKVDGKSIEIIAKAGSSGKLFGSVDNIQIAAAISKQLNVAIDRKKVVCEPLKEMGVHTVSVVLHKEVIAQVTVNIVAEKSAGAAPKAEATPAVVEEVTETAE